MDDLNGRMNQMEQAQRNLEDAMSIHAELEKRSAERIREHADWIARMDAFQEQHALKMSEFDEKLNALIDILDRRERGGMEGRV